MKNKRFLLPLLAILTVCAMLGCPGVNDEPDPYIPPPPDTNFDPSVLHPFRASVPDDFIRGADISNCLEIEQYGGVYRNFNGQVEDIMKILTDNGINYVRIRLWIDPSLHPGHYEGDGNNHIGVTKVIAARAKAAGMKFLLNYHYSDHWADPQQQEVPNAWQDLPTKSELLDALYNYTKESIQELIAAGAEPDMVQLGNEIRAGFLRHHSGASAEGTGYVLDGWRDYSDALSSASRAVREVSPNSKIMIHFDNGGASGILDTFAGFTRRVDTNRPATYTLVDYDVVGLSWYPFWTSHSSIDNLYANIQAFKTRFNKEVVVCESGYLWTVENFDNMSNYAGSAQENSSAALMTNTNGFTTDSGVLFGTRNNGTRYLPGTIENQARVYRAFMDTVVAAGGDGVMWWGADWIAPVPGLRSNSEMATLFDNTGKALPVMKVLGGFKGADVWKPGLITSFKAASTNGAVSLTWDAVNAAIASRYELERAESADGPWITISDSLTGGEYNDTGLDKDITYYYRIRGYNNNGWGDYGEPVEITSFIPKGLRITTTIDTASLTWDALIGANKFEVQRAQAEAGPWTMVNNNVTGTTYTDTGLSPATAYYYRVSAYNTENNVWGDYGDPVQADTLPLVAPENLRITDSTANSLSLYWSDVTGASTYKLYGVQSASADAPAASAYVLVADISSGTVYTHTGLTSGDKWWYIVSAMYTAHGEGPKSPPVSFVVGDDVPLTAIINMLTGTLDFDFTDTKKAASTTDVRSRVDDKDPSAVYTFKALYVVNDADNLYIAMELLDEFGGFNHDRFVFLIDNTSSSLDTGALPSDEWENDRIADTETITGSIEARVYMELQDWEEGPRGVEGASINITAWSITNDVYSPAAPAGSPRVIKFAIPLAGIDHAVTGTELKVAAFFSMGWEEGSAIHPGSFAPRSAVIDFKDTWAAPIDAFIEIDMASALTYTVK